MILTHYYIPLDDKPNSVTTSITENLIEDQQNIAKTLSSYPGRALRRFDNYNDYLHRRKLTESWLHNMFINSGGKPTVKTPFYFVVGESKQLKQDFGCEVKSIMLDTTIIDENHISFTLGDSMGLYFSGIPLKTYSLQEIEYMINNNYDFISSMSFLKPYHRYIEAQLWDKRYLKYLFKNNSI